MGLPTIAFAAGAVAAAAAACSVMQFIRRRRRRVLVVGSINVDLFQRIKASKINFNGKAVDISAIKGMTLPASSFVANATISQHLKEAGLACEKGKEEQLVLSMNGPFDQKTGGKGANTAAAVAQTYACEWFGNLGLKTAEQNKSILRDLDSYGGVERARSAIIPDVPTGTAYILIFEDNDNAIILLGGANQAWPDRPLLEDGKKGKLKEAVNDCCALMLQREVPDYVNVVAAKLASAQGTPVFMDVGGTDAPLDPALMPYISVIAPNETELEFISGSKTRKEGKVQGPLVRKAVAALKAKFADAGNPNVEVLVTLGEYGSVYFGPNWSLENSAANETRMGRFGLTTYDGEPRDTTGAGDAFRGSFVAARYGECRSLCESMKWAAAAASLSVEVEGAMPSMPSRSQISTRFQQPLVATSDL